MAFSLTSPAFLSGGVIPTKYTCDGDGELSPPLAWSDAPEETKSFVLIMDDPDIPQIVKDARSIEAFDHWTLFNIPLDAGAKKEVLSALAPHVIEETEFFGRYSRK